LDAKNQELLKQGKGKSAIEQMSEIGTIFEAMQNMKDYFGGGNEEKSPMDRAFGAIEGLVQNAPSILQAIKSNPQVPQAPQGFMPPPRVQAPPAALAPPQRPMPVIPTPVKSSAPKVRKEDVASALGFIENVFSSSSTPPPPDSVAMTAIAQVDNSVLKALSSRPPEKVISQLESNNMLEGALLGEKGKEYLIAILGALKVRLG
jgi:hypothetical protein